MLSNVIGAILAKIIKQGRIVMLGNVLLSHDNPLRLAEEIARKLSRPSRRISRGPKDEEAKPG